MNPDDLLRVHRDDPAYTDQARREAEHWGTVQPYSMESCEEAWTEGPAQRFKNERFTGDPALPWFDSIARYGPFRRGLTLGTSAISVEARVLETNPGLHMTFADIAEPTLARRQEILGARFPGRVTTRVMDMNFPELEAESYDLIVSSSSVHHVTNLERLAFEINRALTVNGRFFLEDYAGEVRFAASDEKKRLFEAIFNRNVARTPGRRPGVTWHDDADLSPFCAVRSDDIAPVMRQFLDEITLRNAHTLVVPYLRSRAIDDGSGRRSSLIQRANRRLARLRRKLRSDRGPAPIDSRFLHEMNFVGDLCADAGVLLPGVIFGVYGKKPAGDDSRD